MFIRPHNHKWKEVTEYISIKKYNPPFMGESGYYYNSRELRTFKRCIKCSKKKNVPKK